ncbi:MAG TPA: histidine kinase dimerization/phospho-acceptor domain-containing protein [Actinocrinis sp.]|nr:histidine kinase dimerization/phospho-acceptor domain-containing protein [Actinocrinis sp.]
MHAYGRVDPYTGDSEGGDAEAIAALVDVLQPLDQVRAQVLRRVAHALRTPMTSVLGFVEMLAEGAVGPLTEDQRRALAAVDRNVHRLMTLIDAFDQNHPEQRRESAGEPSAPAGGADGN